MAPYLHKARVPKLSRLVPHEPMHAGSRVLCPAVLCALLVHQTLSTDDIKVISNGGGGLESSLHVD